jgi:hypothetical protein
MMSEGMLSDYLEESVLEMRTLRSERRRSSIIVDMAVSKLLRVSLSDVTPLHHKFSESSHTYIPIEGEKNSSFYLKARDFVFIQYLHLGQSFTYLSILTSSKYLHDAPPGKTHMRRLVIHQLAHLLCSQFCVKVEPDRKQKTH